MGVLPRFFIWNSGFIIEFAGPIETRIAIIDLLILGFAIFTAYWLAPRMASWQITALRRTRITVALVVFFVFALAIVTHLIWAGALVLLPHTWVPGLNFAYEQTKIAERFFSWGTTNVISLTAIAFICVGIIGRSWGSLVAFGFYLLAVIASTSPTWKIFFGFLFVGGTQVNPTLLDWRTPWSLALAFIAIGIWYRWGGTTRLSRTIEPI